jgi:membrane associated rhomboid family serine protease
MSNIEQLIRIVLYIGGSFAFGDAVANGAEYQAAVGGLVTAATFFWWAIRNRNA